MNDLQRFLRHVVPGLLFLGLTAFYLFFPLEVDKGKIQSLNNFLNIGVVFTAFFASGTVGFFFSIIHHTLFWSCCYKDRVAIHHGKALKDAMAAGYLELCLLNGDLSSTELNRRGAWRAVVSLWHTRKESSLSIKAADGRIGGLSDLMHGAGANFIGSIAALLVWLFIIWRVCSLRPSWCWVIFTCLLAVGVICLFWRNLRQTALHYQRILEMMLLTELRRESGCKKKPAVLIVSQDDLQKSQSGQHGEDTPRGEGAALS